MPADFEIHLGFVGPKAIYDAIETLNIPIYSFSDDSPVTVDALRSEPFKLFEIDETDLGPVADALQEAYMAIAARLGWSFIRHEDEAYTIFDTPYGQRKTSPFSLCLCYDEDEIGDEPEDATFGINLSSRYYPSVLDVKNPHGTIGTTVDLESMAPEIKICREEIVKRLPAFADAQVFFRQIFY